MTKLEIVAPSHRSGRPKKIIDVRKLERISVAKLEPDERAVETLLIFDARCLDKKTRQELLRLVPELCHIRRAWKSEFLEFGCTSCHRKKTWYGAGGLCDKCYRRILMRMRNRFRKAMEGHTEEVATLTNALCQKYNAAQQLFNPGDE